MKLSKKAARLLEATPGLHLHNGKLRVVFKLPDQPAATKRSLKLEPTEANIQFAANKLGSIKQDITFGLYSNDPGAFWLKHFPAESRVESSPTLASVLEQKYQELLFTWSPSSRKAVGFAIQAVCRHIGGIPIDQLQGSQIREAQQNLLQGVGRAPLSPRTVNYYMSHCKYLAGLYLQELEERSKQPVTNPFKRVQPLKDVRASHDDDSELDIYPFSPQEFTAILRQAKNGMKNLLLRWCAYTGMRPGEVAALAWEDVDLDGGLVRVRYNYSRHSRGLKLPKTVHGIRTIELLPQARDVLTEQFQRTGHLPAELDTITEQYNKEKTIPRRRVFLYPERGGTYRRLNESLTFQTITWSRMLRSANVPYRRFYQLRHTYASWALMNGADPMWLARQMGHSDWGMIRKIYGKWIPQATTSPADALGKKLDAFVPNTSPTHAAILHSDKKS